jgi:hypothetical protein
MLGNMYESHGLRRGDKVKVVQDISESKRAAMYIGQVGTVTDIGFEQFNDEHPSFAVSFRAYKQYPDMVFWKEEIEKA